MNNVCRVSVAPSVLAGVITAMTLKGLEYSDSTTLAWVIAVQVLMVSGEGLYGLWRGR